MTRILVTRPATQALELVELLADAGIDAISVPTVEIAPPDAEALAGAIAGLPGAAWLVLTSANGAAAVAPLLSDGVPPGTRVAAVGPATADALRGAGIAVDHVPDEYLTVAIAEGLGEVHGHRVVLARADAATPDLRDALVARGARVEEVVAYRTVEGPVASRDPLRAALADGIDGIAFTSGSTVRGLVELLPGQDLHQAAGLPVFCIGPVTAEVAEAHGFHVAASADDHTAAGLARAIAAHYAPTEVAS